MADKSIQGEINDQYAKHIARAGHVPFSPDAASSDSLSKLTRDLEKKRQIGALTAAEQRQLRDIDELQERITQFNQKVAGGVLSGQTGAGAQVYNMTDHTLEDESAQEAKPPLIVPKISAEEADKIVATLNQQFEDKVLSKLREQKSEIVQIPDVPPVYSAAGSPNPVAGRSLQDYLTVIRQDKPSVPFADEDSKFDISKLAQKHA
ncbi:hypothetical protein D4R52_01400 [bacterium]|nr:MAG: hypothetical protein D4R52_01400 [bacterium]